MRRAARLLAAMLGTALTLGAAAAGAPTWGSPVQLSSGDRALGPELAVGSSGDAAVVWDQEVGPDCATSPASLNCVHIVELATRRRGASGWQAPVELGRPGIGDRPRVAVDDAGDAVVAWAHDIGRDRVLQATYRSRSATGWPEPSDVSEPSLEVGSFQIGIDAVGDVVAAWTERTASGFAVRVAARTVATGAWGAARTLSPPSGYVMSGLSMASTPDGTAVVAWIEGGVVREIRGDIHAGTWGSVESVSEGVEALGTPDIAFDETTRDIVVVWPSGTTGDCCEIQTAFYSDARSDWERQGPIGDLRDPGERPRVEIDRSGNAVAVWASPRGLESAARAEATHAWSSPVLVSARSANVSDAALALDARGNAAALWATDADVVQAAIRPAASGEWQTPLDLSQRGSSVPRVSLDDAGNAVAVWTRSSPPRVSVEGAVLTGTGPVLSHLTTPRRAIVAGARARLSVRSDPWSAPLAGAPVWEFGDRRSATGGAVSHTYVRPGRFHVTASQADAAGGVSTSTAWVTVIGARVRNVRPPSVRGTPRIGQTLTCLRGTWTGSPPVRYAYSWRRDGTPVPGATTPRYRLRRRDAGSLIACEVEARNPAGAVRAISAVVGVDG